ncbi:carotenoid biosynthesis protein [Patescibacteria group bacterium]|nr:carotenoid biosynthesis protein [Patescibacteria group bacterium]
MKAIKDSNTKTDKSSTFRWFILALIVLTSLISFGGGLLPLLIYFLPAIFIFMHGSKYLGRKNIILFFIVIFIVSYTTEYLGVSTGKIFGDYYYNLLNNGPLVGGVPPLLMLTYFAITYSTYWVVRILLGDFKIIKGQKIVWFALLGGLIATLTDLAADPVNSTVNKVYIWTNGGIFFGVPYLNFIGWLAEITLFFIIISVIFAYITKAPKSEKAPSKSFQLQPIVLFSAPIIPIILRPIWGEQPADIRAAMSLIALFGLGSIILLATLRVFWNNNSK